MKLYADLPGRRTLQVLADVGVLLWVGLWSWLGRVVHDATLQLQPPALQLERAGGSFQRTMTDAARTMGDLPLLGDRLHQPFDQAARTGATISGAGHNLANGIGNLALLLGLLTAVVPIALVVGTWLVLRLRFARRASAAQRLVDSGADLDLFALRAMARQPMPRLAAVSDDPVGAWRSGDRHTVRALAVLELRDCGLRPPVHAVSP